jgi:hypothetical protein
MTAERSRTLPALALACALLFAGACFGLGRASSGGGHGPAAAVVTLAGVPVGVDRSAAGALAAADNYVAIESETLEQDPPAYQRLVAMAFAPAARAGALAAAGQVRASDPVNMANYRRGGRGIAVVAARRLESYTPSLAVVTTWVGGVLWGPALSPRQSWQLVDTTLAWRRGRWMVLASTVRATPAPAPAAVYVQGASDQTQAFQRELVGMSAPFYGAG